jgi:8-oxo-dGTP pyrophosphatase MutT (NUDIX family)
LSSPLQTLTRTLQRRKPRKRWWRRWVKRCAVAIILRERDHRLEVLMIRRAEREGNPWSGHMAFPGGGMETDDQHSLAAAMRETEEEVGIELARCGHCIGRLSDIVSRTHQGRRPMVVTPYVFHLHVVPDIQMNHEVAEVVWVPLDFLADHGNREEMKHHFRGINLTLPCYFYRKRCIWGLSLAMLDELLAGTH